MPRQRKGRLVLPGLARSRHTTRRRARPRQTEPGLVPGQTWLDLARWGSAAGGGTMQAYALAIAMLPAHQGLDSTKQATIKHSEHRSADEHARAPRGGHMAADLSLPASPCGT